MATLWKLCSTSRGIREIMNAKSGDWTKCRLFWRGMSLRVYFSMKQLNDLKKKHEH